MSDDEKITVTIRLIRSFEYRNIKNILIRNVDKKTLVSEFIQLINDKQPPIELIFQIIQIDR
jgi:hypothetical protein